MKALKSIVLILFVVTAFGCNSQNMYRVGNIKYEGAHMPSWFATTVTGVNHCHYLMEVDEAGNCVTDNVTYSYSTGLVPSLLGPALTAGAIAYAGHEIGSGAAKSGSQNSFNANASQSNASFGPWRGHYGHR